MEKPIFGSAAGSTVLLTVTLPEINTVPSSIISVKKMELVVVDPLF
ncbi:hypothetical protein B4155_2419 [Bacillus cereus]|nr:Cell surface protein [Bacillus cereus m1293]KZD78746.1 hypothetical protein B4120_3004 [Bacillus cereus]KZD82558.1 hypothetical protein B4155_2419 [Bacillus cereus]